MSPFEVKQTQAPTRDEVVSDKVAIAIDVFCSLDTDRTAHGGKKINLQFHPAGRLEQDNGEISIAHICRGAQAGRGRRRMDGTAD